MVIFIACQIKKNEEKEELQQSHDFLFKYKDLIFATVMVVCQISQIVIFIFANFLKTIPESNIR